MLRLVLILATLSTASAQTDAAGLLKEAFKGAATTLAPVPEADHKRITTAAADALSRQVNFRPDGTASAIFQLSGNRWHVEWLNLSISRIANAPVSEADRLNGITRRFTVSLACKAHRSWGPNDKSWTAWRPTGFAFFPSSLTFTEAGGKLVLSPDTRLSSFYPGPGSPTQQRTSSPAGDLPPGVTRGR